MTRNGHRDILIDLCIQREYLTEGIPTCCLNAQVVNANVKHVMAFARLTKAPVLSCVDVDRANRIGSEFVTVVSRDPPDQQKAAFTLLPNHAVIESDNSLSVPLDVFRRYQQVIFTKVHRDPFTNPKLDRLLTEMPAHRFVVFGIPLETSLRVLTLGLLRRKRSVVVLQDTCGFWNRQEADMALRQLGVKGCELTTANEYLAEALMRIAQRLRLRIRSSRSVA